MNKSPQPSTRRTEVFISAASADLKGTRALVKRAVDTIGCHGFYQEEFPPDYRKVEEMLRSFIENCDAVIHIVGVCYGSEPRNRPSDKPRRSYTQMEYDIAQELGRPLYVFVCTETFPYDPHSPESSDAAALQLAHRNACLERQEIREKVATTAELEKRVSQLHEHLRRLEREILETSDAVKAVGVQVEEVQSLQRSQIEKLDKQDDWLIKSLRSDLHAKLTRAQELDARDDYRQAIALLEEVYHTARSHGLQQEQLVATLNLGFVTSGKHDFTVVERRLREAEKLIRDVKSPWHRIQFYRLKSKVLQHKKNSKAAEKVLQKAIALSLSDDEGVVEVGLLARADCIHLLCDAKRLDEVDEHLALARDIVEGTQGNHPVSLIADLLEACIHWAISKGDIKQINAFVGAALRHGSGREAAILISHALQGCANGARGMKATNFAVICADAAERLGHVAQRPVLALTAAYTAAGALAENEDFHAARERCLRLIDAAKAVDEPVLRFCVFQLLSQTSRQLGDKTTAVDAAETALRATEGEAIEMCLAKMALAEALRDCGRVKIDGIQALEKSLISTQREPERASIIGQIGSFYAKMGNFQQALVYFQREKKAYESLSNLGGIANALGGIAWMQRELGKPNEEFDTYREIKKLVDGSPYYDLIAGAANNLANCEMQHGNLVEAKRLLEEAEFYCRKYNLPSLFEVEMNQEILASEFKKIKPPELNLEELITDLFDLINSFPESRDSLFRLWFFERTADLHSNYRSMLGVKLMICQDDVDTFLKTAKLFTPYSELCLQVVSTRFPGTINEQFIYPTERGFHPIFSIAAVPKGTPKDAKLKMNFSKLKRRYIAFLGSNLISKATGNKGCLVIGWSVGLPKQAHQLILSSSAADLTKQKVFFLPYERFLANDELLSVLRFSKELCVIPVYFGSLPESEDLKLLTAATIALPILSTEIAEQQRRQIRKVKRELMQLLSITKESAQSALNNLVFEVDELAESCNSSQSIKIQIYAFQFPSGLEKELHIAMVINEQR
jgi:tetratricopeptide (TPR) repeat protein